VDDNNIGDGINVGDLRRYASIVHRSLRSIYYGRSTYIKSISVVGTYSHRFISVVVDSILESATTNMNGRKYDKSCQAIDSRIFQVHEN
jgi:hypothetical protein